MADEPAQATGGASCATNRDQRACMREDLCQQCVWEQQKAQLHVGQAQKRFPRSSSRRYEGYLYPSGMQVLYCTRGGYGPRELAHRKYRGFGKSMCQEFKSAPVSRASAGTSSVDLSHFLIISAKAELILQSFRPLHPLTLLASLGAVRVRFARRHAADADAVPSGTRPLAQAGGGSIALL